MSHKTVRGACNAAWKTPTSRERDAKKGKTLKETSCIPSDAECCGSNVSPGHLKLLRLLLVWSFLTFLLGLCSMTNAFFCQLVAVMKLRAFQHRKVTWRTWLYFRSSVGDTYAPLSSVEDPPDICPAETREDEDFRRTLALQHLFRYYCKGVGVECRCAVTAIRWTWQFVIKLKWWWMMMIKESLGLNVSHTTAAVSVQMSANICTMKH